MNIPITNGNNDPFRALPVDGELSPLDAIRVGPLPDGELEHPFASALKRRTDQQSIDSRSLISPSVTGSKPTALSENLMPPDRPLPTRQVVDNENPNERNVIDPEEPPANRSRIEAAAKSDRLENDEPIATTGDDERQDVQDVNSSTVESSCVEVATPETIDETSAAETSPPPIVCGPCDDPVADEADDDRSPFDEAVILPFPGSTNPPPPQSLIDLISVNDTTDDSTDTDAEPIFVQLPQIGARAGIAPLPASLAEVLTVPDTDDEAFLAQQAAAPIHAQIGIDAIHLQETVDTELQPQQISQTTTLQTESVQIGLFDPSDETDTDTEEAASSAEFTPSIFDTEQESVAALATTTDIEFSSPAIAADKISPDNAHPNEPLDGPHALQTAIDDSADKFDPVAAASPTHDLLTAEISGTTDAENASEAQASIVPETSTPSVEQQQTKYIESPPEPQRFDRPADAASRSQVLNIPAATDATEEASDSRSADDRHADASVGETSELLQRLSAISSAPNLYQPTGQPVPQTVSPLATPSNAIGQTSAVTTTILPAEIPASFVNRAIEMAAAAAEAPMPAISEQELSTVSASTGGPPTIRTSPRPMGELNPSRQLDRLASLIQQSEQQDRGLIVRLHPPELGALQIEVNRRDGMLIARIEVQTQAAHQLLGDSLPKLHEALAQLGATVERIDLQLVAAEVSQEQPRFDNSDQNSQQKSDRQEQNPADPSLQHDQTQTDARDQNPSDSSSRRYRLDDPASEDQTGQNATQGPHAPPGQKSRPHFKPLDRIDIHI